MELGTDSETQKQTTMGAGDLIGPGSVRRPVGTNGSPLSHFPEMLGVHWHFRWKQVATPSVFKPKAPGRSRSRQVRRTSGYDQQYCSVHMDALPALVEA